VQKFHRTRVSEKRRKKRRKGEEEGDREREKDIRRQRQKLAWGG
jgi:hypothetical protein